MANHNNEKMIAVSSRDLATLQAALRFYEEAPYEERQSLHYLDGHQPMRLEETEQLSRKLNS